MNLEQLRTLAAVLDHGSFDRAATELGVSPPAISQRIRALEHTIGKNVLVRTSPCRPTEAGRTLLRAARGMALIEDEAKTSLGLSAGTASSLMVAVNADSLATWFSAVLEPAAAWDDVVLQVSVTDENLTADRLRAGRAHAAVSTDPGSISGCQVLPLGTMRYLPVVLPRLWERHGASGEAWHTMPVVRYHEHDDYHEAALNRRGVRQQDLRIHHVTSSEGALAGIRSGLGWGMVPEIQARDDIADGTLQVLSEDDACDVALFWQVLRIPSDRLDRMTAAVVEAASRWLRPHRRRSSG